MNYKHLDSFTAKLDNPVRLINELIDSDYSFAMWSLPLAQSYTIAIDIHKNELTKAPIDELQAVFAINNFSDSHPPEPTYIRSDLLIEVAENNDYEIKVDPSISSSLLDEFLVDRNKEKLIRKRVKTTNHFEEIVQKAIEKINEGLFEKVVLSRFKDIAIPSLFKPFDFFQKLIAHYPNAFNYMVFTPNHGLWIGATPEKLIDVDYSKDLFSTDALAGTQPLDGRKLNEVAWTMKEIEEQAMVSRYIVDGFKKIRLREFDEVGPKTVKAGNLAHLKTEFRVDMKKANAHGLDKIMLDLLHPTSAVCGFPRTSALDFITKNENYNRELYAGFLGPVRFQNKTNLFVNLRCMQVFDDSIRLYAGAGITADSLPHKEWEETEHKMNTLLSLLQDN
ncbi:MAG: chorismate-binding protein [Cyclobacteriaceae bacterium]